VITNHSEAVAAEQFRFICDSSAIGLMYEGEPVDILPGADMRWGLTVFAQSPLHLKLTMRWEEDGELHERAQTIAL
jgi:hypothetical protein